MSTPSLICLTPQQLFDVLFVISQRIDNLLQFAKHNNWEMVSIEADFQRVVFDAPLENNPDETVHDCAKSLAQSCKGEIASIEFHYDMQYVRVAIRTNVHTLALTEANELHDSNQEENHACNNPV